MKTASVEDMKARLNACLKASAKEPVVVTRQGKPIAVLLGVDDEEELEQVLLAHSVKLQKILEAADRRIQKGGGLSHEEFWSKVEATSKAAPANGARKKSRSKT